MAELPFFTGEEGRGNLLVLLFFVAAFVITVWGTWESVLPAGDEAVLAETAREIVTTGKPLPMHFNGAPAHDTPPLAPWLMSFFFLVFGVNEFAARFAFVILYVAAAYAVLLAGRAAAGDLSARAGAAGAGDPGGRDGAGIRTDEAAPRTQWGSLTAGVGFLSAIILAASPLLGRFSTHVTTGLPFAFFTALALLGWFYLPGKRIGLLFWGLGIAGSILSIGAAGALVIAGAAVAGAVDRARRGVWRMPGFVAATAAGAAVGALWLVPAAARGGGFHASPLWAPVAALVRPGPHAARELLAAAANVWVRNLPWSIPAAIAVVRIIFSAGGRRRRAAVGEVDSALLVFMAVMFVPVALAGAEPLSAFLPVVPFAAMLSAREIGRWALASKRNPAKRVWTCNHVMTALFCLLMLLVVATLVSLRRTSADPIRELARVGGRITPEDASIGNFRQNARAQGARMLFYGNRRLDEPLAHPADVAALLRGNPDKLVLASVGDLESLRAHGDFQIEIRILYGAGDLVLFGARDPRRDEAP